MTNLFNPWLINGTMQLKCLGLRALVLSRVDGLGTVLGILSVNGAAKTAACSEHLEDGSLEVLGVGAGLHGAGNVVDIVPRDVTVVGDVLNLLTVPWRLLEGLNDKGGGRWHNLDSHLRRKTNGEPLSRILCGIIMSLIPT